MLLAKIDHLLMLALSKIPKMQLVPIAAAEEMIWLEPVFYLIRSTPLATDQRIMPQVPPEIVSQFLRTTVDFPSAEHIKVVMVDEEDSAWPVSIRCTQGANVNALRATVDSVRAGITGALKDFLRLDGFHDFEFSWIRLGVDNVNARRSQSRDNEITPLDMRVRGIRTQSRTARIPTKVVQFITDVWQVYASGDFAIRVRRWIKVDYQKRVTTRFLIRSQGRNIRIALDRSLHC